MAMSPKYLRPRASSPVAAPTDPDFAYVAMLLHMEGTNGSTSFTDSSSHGHTVATLGTSPTISTAQSKFGTSSGLIYGSGSASSGLEIGPDAALNLGGSDFTLEMFIYSLGDDSGDQTLSRCGGGDGVDGILFSHAPNYTFASGGSGWDLIGGETLSGLTSNQWQHVALCRNGNTWAGFVDGVASWTQTASGSVSMSSDVIRIGCANSGGEYAFSGYIDEVRLTVGVCRYPNGTTFTPPAAPFPDQ